MSADHNSPYSGKLDDFIGIRELYEPASMTEPQANVAAKRSTHKSFKRLATANVVKHGDMSQRVADTIFLTYLRLNDEEESSPQDREMELEALAEALMFSTSEATDYSNVIFSVDGEERTLDTLNAAAVQHYEGPNPVRTWTRCYQKGEMCARISDLLGFAENVAIRQRAAAQYDVDLSEVHLCFDTAEGLYNTGRAYSHAERRLISSAKIFATKRALERSQDKGDVRPQHDSSGRPSGEPVAMGLLSSGSETRTGFKSLRG